MSLMMPSSESALRLMMMAWTLLLFIQRTVQQQIGHPDDTVHQGTDLVLILARKSLFARLAASALTT